MGANDKLWPADHVERVEIDKLVPYARNSRTHTDDQVDRIASSMREWGWTNPALIAEDGTIIAGHGRILAAKKLGLTHVPVMVARGWTDAQRRAYVVADNQLAIAGAGWNLDMLKIELDDLKASGFDLDLVGFDDEEFNKLFPDIEPLDNGKDPDAVPDVPDEPFTKPGQMWFCGPHRVLCGSSTDMDDWNRLMQGELADIQVCDPPYCVNYESKLAGKIKNDNMNDAEFYQFLLGFYTCSFAVMKPGAAMYVAHADTEGANFRAALKNAGFHLKCCLVWVKNAFVLSRGDFHFKHEPLLYATKPGAPRRWYGGRKNATVQEVGEYPPFQKMEDGRYAVVAGDRVLYVDGAAAVEEVESTLLHFNKPIRSAMHPTTKPVALWEKLAGFNARPKDIMIDGFGGSGTTMIAGERLGMVTRLMELDPRFVDVICVRYHMLTGRVPVDAETGEEFSREVIARLSEMCSETTV